MLDKIREGITGESKDVFRLKVPIHIAITMEGTLSWASKHKLPCAKAYSRAFEILKNIVKNQVKLKIPVMTFFMLPETEDKAAKEFSEAILAISGFLDSYSASEFVNQSKIKLSVIGKWYDLPGSLVETIKKAINETKDYDGFFVNFCINYGGQEEITDACRLIARQVKAGKLDPESISKTTIKENVYSSYFTPPDLIIVNGYKKRTSGLLLWDSANSKISFSNKLFPDFDRIDLIDAIREFQKGE